MSATPEEVDSRKTFRRLGAISVLVGALSVCRLGLEIYLTRTLPTPPGYFASIGYDLLLALAACISGAGLLQRRPWAMPCTLIAAAALFLSSVVLLVESGTDWMKMLLVIRMNQNLGLWAAWGSRWFMTFIHAIYWPIMAGLLYIDLQCRPPEEIATRKAKRLFWLCVVAALPVCGAIELLLRKLEVS